MAKNTLGRVEYRLLSNEARVCRFVVSGSDIPVSSVSSGIDYVCVVLIGGGAFFIRLLSRERNASATRSARTLELYRV